MEQQEVLVHLNLVVVLHKVVDLMAVVVMVVEPLLETFMDMAAVVLEDTLVMGVLLSTTLQVEMVLGAAALQDLMVEETQLTMEPVVVEQEFMVRELVAQTPAVDLTGLQVVVVLLLEALAQMDKLQQMVVMVVSLVGVVDKDLPDLLEVVVVVLFALFGVVEEHFHQLTLQICNG